MAHFEKREWSENTYYPEICGVDFSQRLAQFMGEVALDGTEIYTAWLVDDDFDIQITPESSRVFISLIDDDSDTITVLDPRDSLWFNFMRVNHAEYFDTIRQLISPWSTVTASLTPAQEVYARFLKTVTQDAETEDLHIPDDWL